MSDQKITVRTLFNDWDYIRCDIKGLTAYQYGLEDLAELEAVSQAPPTVVGTKLTRCR